MNRALVCVLAALVVTGTADASVRQTFGTGLAAVQTGDYHVRARAARHTIARLRAEHAPRRAVGGFDDDSGRLAEPRSTPPAPTAAGCMPHGCCGRRAVRSGCP